MKAIGSMLVLMLASGCVMQKTYDASQAAVSGCRAELQQCDAARRQCGTALEGCEAQNAGLQEQLTQSRTQAVSVQTEAQALEQRANELRGMLQAEIAAKDVEIEQLRDRLSVHVLDRILFTTGSAEILPAGRAVLDKLASALATGSESIRVEGHTDRVPIGPVLQARYPSNWELSTARASSVVRYFQDRHQIDPLRLEAVGYSMYRPVATGDTPDDLQRNRRVEIVLTEAE
ncbi:MAG: OmpA family protein [Nevskiales bacterium]|nr:OmpA family protein [Nevskiales bacterium]